MVFLQVEKPQICIFEANEHTKAKAGEYNQSSLCFPDDFERFTPCTATYFLVVSANHSPKVAANVSFGGKRISK